MQEVENLVKTTLVEIEKMLSTKAVVGEPVTVEGKTLVPLIAFGFCFGAGGGSGRGEEKAKGEGIALGATGGGGVKPVAVIVIDSKGVRIESVRGPFTSVLGKIVETVPELADKVADKFPPRKKKEDEK